MVSELTALVLKDSLSGLTRWREAYPVAAGVPSRLAAAAVLCLCILLLLVLEMVHGPPGGGGRL
jgi:hypothetical protein